MYVCIYIYIQRERERYNNNNDNNNDNDHDDDNNNDKEHTKECRGEGEECPTVSAAGLYAALLESAAGAVVQDSMMCIYIYIYIERERQINRQIYIL